MYDDINLRLNELLNVCDNNKIINDFCLLKGKVEIDEKVLLLIDKFNNNQSIETKKELYNIPLYKEYKDLEREIYYLTLEITKRLNTLTDIKKCQKS
jgi:hypothetical protein